MALHFSNKPYDDGTPYICFWADDYDFDITGIMPVDVAEKIVRAFNAHDGLLSASENLLDSHVPRCDQVHDSDACGFCRLEREIANAKAVQNA